ncbi:LysE family transporter [Gloeocapsopsis sp. IPPAS B-1203]|uniref:LysE family transporter n=1 Tax=Gloeocapsopsis sp. IPPAS B-1203 TaxID=2049454 RepID=UPI000C18F858|nr:LysE family transporter [Gloeocapsopsis sp. IPPAS B-1203]PIG93198.1 chemotaxis protein [Gloeocapsopsis sp. IPPAS B-1203]
MFALFFTALFLGFIFNAAPGAVFAETIRQGIRGGFKGALAVQIGSLVGDALWAVLGLTGVGLLLQWDLLRLPIGLAGVLYLLWLAGDAWQEANKEFSIKLAPTNTYSKKALRSGILLSITNPQNIAYWAALGSAMGAIGVSDPTVSHNLIFFTGFMVASFLWSFVCAGLVTQVFQRSQRDWTRLTYRACAIAFLLLAFSSLRNLWSSYVAPQDSVQPPAIHSEP